MRETARWRRIGIQIPLGFSSGIPLYLTGSTLLAWLATANADVSFKTIGAFSLVALPYNCKWLFAPLLDRFGLPLLSRRRDWMLVTQLCLAVSIAWLGAVNAPFNLATAAIVAVVVAFFSASQDIVIDAYRTDSLGKGERGRGGAAYVTGYRIAMIAASSGALLMANHISWQSVYWILASMMSVGVVATFLAPPLVNSTPPRNLRDAVVEPFVEFFQRRGAIIALLFIMLYKVGDFVALQMVTPFLLKELHFDLVDVALLQKFLGIGATIVGAAIGGVAVDRIGVRKGLLIFGVVQAIANIGYVFLAMSGKNYGVLVVAIGFDNLCNGLGTVAFVAYLMSMCHRKFSAAQHALLASAMTILARLLTATSGYVVEFVGWEGFFAITIVVAAPALVLWKWLPAGLDEQKPEEAKQAKAIVRIIAQGVSLTFFALSVWKFVEGNWKVGTGLIVPALAFLAYSLASAAPSSQKSDDEQ